LVQIRSDPLDFGTTTQVAREGQAPCQNPSEPRSQPARRVPKLLNAPFPDQLWRSSVSYLTLGYASVVSLNCHDNFLREIGCALQREPSPSMGEGWVGVVVPQYNR
jgi:hypothetical protein